MIKVLVLGANGMLGHACMDVIRKFQNIEVVGSVRGKLAGFIDFDVKKDSVTQMLEFAKPDWIINCIGIIKPHIKEEQAATVRTAIEINSEFPFSLANATDATIIQIATDCVYSGTKGKYTESDLHDALDVYGKTKSLGEAPLKNVIHLRASIIGPELGRSTSLLEWFRNQPLNAELNGFTDHLWNGVTTHHFAMLAVGIISNDFKDVTKTHIVPEGLITKSDLLREFAKAYDRSDITVNDVTSNFKIDRTLNTVNHELNRNLWRIAGYQEIPTVAQMVQEQAEIIVKS